MTNKEAILTQVRTREKQLLDQLNEVERRKQRIDTMYTAYGLFGDCLEHTDKTKIKNVDQFIIASKHDLKEEDLEELRKVRNWVLNEIDVTIKPIFVFPKKSTSHTTQSILSNSQDNSTENSEVGI